MERRKGRQARATPSSPRGAWGKGGGDTQWLTIVCYTEGLQPIPSSPPRCHWGYSVPERGHLHLHKVTLYLHNRSIIMKSRAWYKIILSPHARVFDGGGRKCHVYHDSGYGLIIQDLVTQKNRKGLESPCLAVPFLGLTKGISFNIPPEASPCGAALTAARSAFLE